MVWTLFVINFYWLPTFDPNQDNRNATEFLPDSWAEICTLRKSIPQNLISSHGYEKYSTIKKWQDHPQNSETKPSVWFGDKLMNNNQSIQTVATLTHRHLEKEEKTTLNSRKNNFLPECASTSMCWAKQKQLLKEFIASDNRRAYHKPGTTGNLGIPNSRLSLRTIFPFLPPSGHKQQKKNSLASMLSLPRSSRHYHQNYSKCQVCTEDQHPPWWHVLAKSMHELRSCHLPLYPTMNTSKGPALCALGRCLPSRVLLHLAAVLGSGPSDSLSLSFSQEPLFSLE